jgi:hypothetical protein
MYKHVKYELVKDKDLIRKIEAQSEYWIVRTDERFYILVQADSQNRPLGNIKLVEKSKARKKGVFNITVEANADDWTYYKRRKE